IHTVSMSPDLTYVWQHDATYGYMKASAYVGAPKASDAWIVSPVFDLSAAQAPSFNFDHVINKFPSIEVAKQQVSVCVSVDGGDWQKVTVTGWSDNASWKPFANSGDIDLSAYVGKKIQIGFHYTSTDEASGTWEVNNFVINGSGSITVTATTFVPGGGGSGENPDPGPGVDPVDGNTADFNTFNGGEPKSSYGTYTTASGWTAVNAAIQCGSDGGGDSNPKFNFLGSSSTFAVCLNGKTTTVGTLTSPMLKEGLSKLTFNYGYAFGDTACKFTVNIKQGGNVVQSKTVEGTLTKFDVHTFTWDVTVKGDFVIEVINDCPSNSTSNKDRLSIWNLTWDN
ncbi:MAG: choice-of-anchor J domain-containing protein, partial [Muribaculaceae bacterium]|nr:choice-of-anchor J domain-containing protein [Muribaculaceae bacterium]